MEEARASAHSVRREGAPLLVEPYARVLAAALPQQPAVRAQLATAARETIRGRGRMSGEAQAHVAPGADAPKNVYVWVC